MASAAVRVGIVSWNTADLLERCLRALPAALAGIPAEVVIVDNASADASSQVAVAHAARAGEVSFVASARNVGYARAMNQALAGSNAPVLIALNPDTEPPPGSLATLVARLRGDPGLGLVAPQLVNADRSPQYTARRFPSPTAAAVGCLLPVRWHDGALGRRLLLEAATPPRAPADVDWVIGAVHVIRASALAGRPPYDERWFMYGEDLELCWWLARRGWRRRLEADVHVPHIGNAAGAQAWGDDYDRRCFDAIYDWYQRDVGARPVRVTAAINAINAGSRAIVGRLAGRPRDHVANRIRAARYHAMIARHGPPPSGPPQPPPPPAAAPPAAPPAAAPPPAPEAGGTNGAVLRGQAPPE